MGELPDIFYFFQFLFNCVMVPACLTLPLILIHRSTLRSKQVLSRGGVLIYIGSYISLFSIISFPLRWPYISDILIAAGISLIYSLVVTSIIYLIKRKSEAQEINRQQEIEATIAKFQEHGGAKRKPGPYVPSNAWGINAKAGVGFGTAHSSSEKHGAGMHRMPLP